MVMWELGGSAYAAVASTYLQKKLLIFKLDLATMSWSLLKNLAEDGEADKFGEVFKLKVIKFFKTSDNKNYEIVHLFVAR